MTIPIAWQPDSDAQARARLTEFLQQCGEPDFASLQRRSAEDVEWFTGQLLHFLGVKFEPHYKKLLDVSAGVEWARWCVGGGLNISHLCLAGKDPSQTAIAWEGEEGMSRAWSYRALIVMVKKCAAGLRDLGVKKGDAVGVHLPMMPETAAVLLALARIGAVAVPLFTGYGPAAIAERMNDVGAVCLFTANAFPRRGRVIPSKVTVDEALQRCETVRHVVVVPRLENVPVPMQADRDLTWDAVCQRGHHSHTEHTSAEDPLLIVYTSGTTGRPKGIVHAHCGFPLKSAADMAFGFDVGAGTRISWITDIGWMMGPWLIYGSLILGGTMVLFDGAPDFPHPARLWAYADRQAVAVLGLSPTLVRSLKACGDDWARRYRMPSLRFFGSTGEPWNPEPWWWLYEHVGRGLAPIINYSGGTEISGGILCDNPLLGGKPCGFAAPCLGIAADVVNEQGESVRGEVGELVIRKPWLGMARGFYKDAERYLDTYWRTFPGVWRHGDFARIDEDGYWFITGRSDDTIKVAGKRVGPAEVESVLVGHPQVREAAAVAVPDAVKGSAIAVFVVVRESSGGVALEEELKDRVARELGKPLRPSVVVRVRGIPKTRNGKIMRRLVRAAWLGEPPGDVTALEDPTLVDEIARAGKMKIS
ncbi:MAG TPA: AMP-binding protein [Bryobacteraceae bacterium]|nr:AMP-binding protein [Bryobacteraceae bacterium]